MNDDQITALSREYAEWVTQQEGDKAYIPAEQAIASAFLHWLTHRFCLVEKEKLRAIRFRKVYSAEDMRNKFTEECLIDALFPEIAKEVVG